MVGKLVEANIGELEEDVRAVCSRTMRKDSTNVVQGISGKNRFLVMFQDRCENYLTSNQLTTVIVENIPMKKEYEVPTNPEIPEEEVTSEKVYYHGV